MTRIAVLIATTALAAWLVYEWGGLPWLVAAVLMFGVGSALAIRDLRR